MELEILQRAHPVLVAELDPEGVLDGLRGCAVAAAGVAHEDEDVLGAVGPKLYEHNSALLLLLLLLLLPLEELVLVLLPAKRGYQGGRGGPIPACPASSLP